MPVAEEKTKLSEEIENYIATFLLAVMVVASALGVIYRYVVQDSLSWSEELSRFSFVWFCYLAASYAVIKRSNIIIDLLNLTFGRFAPRLPGVLRLIGFIFWLGFACFMCIIGYEFVLKTNVTGEISAGLGIPIVWVYCSVPVGFALITLRLVQLLFQDYLRPAEKKPEAKTDTLID
jgi:TRAP-type C4-dicarboxylate transport system permease small subunit